MSPDNSLWRPFTEPIRNPHFRFAPSRDGKIAAMMWRIWSQGNEVYALYRKAGGGLRLSFHFTGQIHRHLEKGNVEIIRPPLLLSEGVWTHCFEWRFLIDENVLRPPREHLKPGETAWLIDCPLDNVVILNLLIAAEPTAEQPTLPREFNEAAPLWHARRGAGHHILLVSHRHGIVEENREILRHLRHDLAPQANLAGPEFPTPYVEVTRLDWSEKGSNVLIIVPMGREGYRMQPFTAPTP